MRKWIGDKKHLLELSEMNCKAGRLRLKLRKRRHRP